MQYSLARRGAFRLIAGRAPAVLLLLACGNGVAPQVEVQGISLTPGSALIFVGDSLRLNAAALDAQGRPISGRAISFQSSDPSVATVSAEGVAVGRSRGSASIEASVGGWSSVTVVTVRTGGIVGPDGATISFPGGAMTLTVPPGAVAVPTEVDLDSGRVQTGEQAPLRGTMFAIGPAGLALSLPGALTIHYDPAGLSVGDERSAGLYMENGPGWLAVQGSSADLAHQSVIGPVSHAGSYAVLAPGPVATLTISPSSVIVVFGTNQQLLCELRDSTGQVLGNRPIFWTSSDTTVAQVSQLGRVTPISLGYAQITAASGGAAGVANITAAFSCYCPGLPTDVARTAGACFCAGSTAGSR